MLRYSVLVLVASPLSAQGEARYRRDLTELTAPALAGREAGTAGGELAIRYIAAEMEAAGLRPWVRGAFRQDFEVRGAGEAVTLETANVIGWLPGADPELAGEYVVVGAHHDHLGRGQYGSLGGPAAVGAIHPGADDNASGVAGLLQLARSMGSGPRPRRSVLFVAFGAKELGRKGSRHFLKHAPVDSGRIVAMVNLDMIGRAESCALRIEESGSGDGLRRLLERRRPTTHLRVKLGTGTSPDSDHREFLAARIPSLLFHTGLSEQYRSPADLPCLIEVDGALEVVQLVRGVVSELADRRDRPRFRDR